MSNKLSNVYKGDYSIEVKEISHHGELMQGVFEGNDGQLHRGLVTLKCSLYTSTAIFIKQAGLSEIKIVPNGMIKALNAAKATLEYIGKDNKYGGYLILQNDIPEEMGFGSSTSNVVSCIRAVSAAFDIVLTPLEIAKIAVNSENASDSIMFDECILFAQREGVILENYHKPLPPMYIIGFSVNERGVNTLEYEPAQYTFEEVKTFKILKGLFEYAIKEQKPELIGEVATASAIINQKYLPKPNFSNILEIAENTNALGIQVAHSGTIVGIMYPYDISIEDKIIEVKKSLEKIDIFKLWVFDTNGN